MNLPAEWRAIREKHVGASTYILLDGAMRQDLGLALAQEGMAARSLMPSDLSDEGKSLGAWLVQEERAFALGLSGVASGVSYLLTQRSLDDQALHLQPWMFPHLSGNEGTHYLRLADARVLQRIWPVWSMAQRRIFGDGCIALCMADRDGQPRMILPFDAQTMQDESHEPAVAELDEAQYQQLLEASQPDALLHALGEAFDAHPTFALREQQYQVASSVIRDAKLRGIDAPEDWLTLMAWTLRAGDPAYKKLFTLSAMREGLRGQELWLKLMEDNQ